MRLLYEENIEDIAIGAAVLGSGGGSNPYIGKLMAREAIRQYGPVELYTLDELDDDDLFADPPDELTLLGVLHERSQPITASRSVPETARHGTMPNRNGVSAAVTRKGTGVGERQSPGGSSLVQPA